MAVALFDWDNTLHAGWTLDGWVRWLVDRGVMNGDRQPEWDALKQSYLDGVIDHSQLATAANEGYADAVRGWSVDEACALAGEFVAAVDRHTVYPWVGPLLRWLAEQDIRPVIVTGAPQELLAEHVAPLELPGEAELHGLRLPSADGRYLGRLDVNSGTDTGKREILERLVMAGEPVELAAGDSSSDRPLLAAARHQLIVGARPALLTEFAGTALAVPDPAGTDGDAMIERVAELLAS